jgi:toluene monooxygenase electron transfer component
MPTVTVVGTGIQFAASGGDTILQAALRAGVEWPYECSVGACGTCRFNIESGEVDVLRDDPPGLSPFDKRKNRLLACQCIATGELSVNVRIGVDDRPVAIRPYRSHAMLTSARAVTHDLTEYCFRGGRAAEFLPGQYALLDLPGVGATRAYSMSNLPNDEGEWTFLIRRVNGGSGTRALAALRPGDAVILDAPYGGAHLREDVKRDIVCIAGGSGLAPMLSIARAKSGSAALRERKLHFYYGGRTPADTCSRRFLEKLEGYEQDIHCIEAVSDLLSAGTGQWNGPIGPIHEVVKAHLPERFDTYEFYVSGPPPMIAAVLTLLGGEHRVPSEQIHFDRFF